MARARRDDLPRFQRHSKLAQFVGEPRQRHSGITEHILAVTNKLLAAHGDDRPLLDEIARPSALVGGPSTNRCAQALSGMICAAPALTKSANRESGISMAGCSVSTAS